MLCAYISACLNIKLANRGLSDYHCYGNKSITFPQKGPLVQPVTHTFYMCPCAGSSASTLALMALTCEAAFLGVLVHIYMCVSLEEGWGWGGGALRPVLRLICVCACVQMCGQTACFYPAHHVILALFHFNYFSAPPLFWINKCLIFLSNRHLGHHSTIMCSHEPSRQPPRAWRSRPSCPQPFLKRDRPLRRMSKPKKQLWQWTSPR